ncbi:unnamed protein product [Didymodactylos carnosus]|uniref:Transposase n=1 Tax=Didymodactylos carnosus TaxID=1234261 RepID=A0A813YCX4_9BILA|nr:unnamed protein product [Didymodactylos carnosus]CAF0882371.1 unnamed protein product [Didymodactylos carnosus]CAF3520196.1 unnamed protein product [Didymodactylos carnosus]CAF3668322.1 unnamed protein product [Didymodactylos carnosus]
MAGTYNTEQERIIDRIKCIAFREARDTGAAFINRQWIADKIRRTTRFVTECQDIIHKASSRQGKSCSIVAREIAEEQKEYVTGRTINNYRHREGLKPFNVIPKPLKTETYISNRLWLCDWLEDWTEEDFLHLAPSDEFYVWIVRRPNYQNDRIWALNVEDIEEDERYQNVIDPDEVTFVHDKVPCMRANKTQHLLQGNNVKFWGNDIWPGNSRNLNVAERIGSIIKDEVEKKTLSETGHNRYLEDILTVHITNVLTNIETDTDLFETLLRSYPSRLRAVKNANGRHTHY